MAASPTVSVLRDALVVAFVAVLTVQALRRWVGDRYLVPSDSMQPVLFGDPERGDIVFVDKLASAADRRRGDLVVVANERLPGHQLVKRIAASGDDPDACWIDIENGDLLLGPDRQHMRRETREPRRAMVDSITWSIAGTGDSASRLDLAAAAGDGPWRLPPAASSLAELRSALQPRSRRARFRDLEDGVTPSGAIGTRVAVDATYLDIEGRRSQNGDDVLVADCGIELTFGELPEVVVATIDSTDFGTTFVWTPAQDYVEVWLDGRRVREQREVLGAPWRGSLTYGRLDGRDFLLLDDAGQVLLAVPGESTLPRPRTFLHVMTTGERQARIDRLRVFRDVFRWRQPSPFVAGDGSWPRFVPPGHWFLLGDNAFDSEDSRYHGPISAEHFLGVPRWVLGPASRVRRLP